MLGLPIRGMTLAIIAVIGMSAKLQKGAITVVVFFSMEKMLLYWSVDQYNYVPKKGKVARVAGKDLILRQCYILQVT